MLFGNVIQYYMIGAVITYLMLRLRSTTNKPPALTLLICAISGIICILYYIMLYFTLNLIFNCDIAWLGGIFIIFGMIMVRGQISRDYLRLNESPLATQARYQSFKINPNHICLQGFEKETSEWLRYESDYNPQQNQSNESQGFGIDRIDQNKQFEHNQRIKKRYMAPLKHTHRSDIKYIQ